MYWHLQSFWRSLHYLYKETLNQKMKSVNERGQTFDTHRDLCQSEKHACMLCHLYCAFTYIYTLLTVKKTSVSVKASINFLRALLFGLFLPETSSFSGKVSTIILISILQYFLFSTWFIHCLWEVRVILFLLCINLVGYTLLNFPNC